MKHSKANNGKNAKRNARLAAAVLILVMAVPMSTEQAALAGDIARHSIGRAFDYLRSAVKPNKEKARNVTEAVIESLPEREAKITRIRLCPRRLLVYAGEDYALSPLPLDNKGEPVHGVGFAWESSDDRVARVASDGTVIATGSGRCFVTASVGNRKAKVRVEVRSGQRPRQTNSQYDAEHAGDCKDPENDPEEDNTSNTGTRQFIAQDVGPLEDSDPVDTPDAAAPFNATGHPRFAPDLDIQSGMDNQLGSSNFNLTIPVHGSSGRGLGSGLALVYNSRVWTKDNDTEMIFNYDGGWPAPGFRLNYGRIIQDYDGSGILNYLLIEADGTRTPLLNQGTGVYRSQDGRYLEFHSSTNRLFLTDGTRIKYRVNGSSLLPEWIKDVHGNRIDITYVDRSAGCSDALRVSGVSCNCGNGCCSGCGKPPRQAINKITDTLGRHITFYYYANGSLAEIRAAGYNNGPDRVIAKFYYQTITLSYNFGGLLVQNAPAGNQFDALKRVYFPETGRGFVFTYPNPGYGMFTKASMRLGMTDASEGTEVAYTEYVFNTSGSLSDAPEFIQRKEWWKGKTDDAGTEIPSTSPAVFDYERENINSTIVSTVTGPNDIATIMVSNDDPNSVEYGSLTEQRIEKDGVILSKQEFSYENLASTGGLQRKEVRTTDDGSLPRQTRTEIIYGEFGRLINVIEYGFPDAGVFKKRRRTQYSYQGVASNPSDPYIQRSLYHLVTDIKVFDAKLTSSNTDDVIIARQGFEYDSPGAGWEMEFYGLTQNCQIPACSPPPGFDTDLIDFTARGLITKSLLWSNATAASADISFRSQYDLFGNLIKAETGCCSLRRFSFSSGIAGLHFSVPLSVIDGPDSGSPNLSSSVALDFNTGFLNSETDANGLVTTYAPEVAFTSGGSLRLRTITYPKLSDDANANPRLETFFDDPSYPNKDGLVYQSKLSYMEDDTQRVIISKQWLDGAGRVIRSGSDTGTGFDAAKQTYDDWGRLRKVTNPYFTTSSNGDTAGLPFPTTYDYDGLHRAVTVTLPDNNIVTTTYNGAITTVTDQAGRKRESETDGLGRITRVTEMDSSKLLNWHTNFSYDLNDNLTEINQGGQIRSFKYDGLSRMIFERTPEQAATINDGTNSFWSAKYTYTSFNAVSSKQDARGVVSTFSYDQLNRLQQIQYTMPNPNSANVQATSRVNIAYGSEAPKLGLVEEVRQTDSSNAIPWKETYDYDGLSRLMSKTVSFDNLTRQYTTGYSYNQTGQIKSMTYPSNRVVKYGYDSRARLNTVGDANLATRYVASIGYTPSQQVASVGLGNGVSESFSYNSRLQLQSQSATKGGTTLMSLVYNYTAAKSRFGGVGSGAANTGQLADVTATIKDQTGTNRQRNESYSYDQVGRLVQAGPPQQGGGFYSQRTYSYDRWGNRTQVSGGSSQNIAYAADQNGVPVTNRIASVNSIAYSYDAAGNLTSDGAHTYLYDAESRIVSADSGAVTYGYDTANRRVRRQQGSAVTYYIWEGSQVIAEYSNATQLGAGGTRFYHADRLSCRMITDSAGTVKGAMDNLPFGEEGGVTGESDKRRFTSYERDTETASDYAINRQYSMVTGRFSRPDPVGGILIAPQSYNRYAYVLNDPVNLIDPLGLYEPCVHTAMTRFLAKHAGLPKKIARKLGRYAGDAPGGADSSEFMVMGPSKIYSKQRWGIHFPTEAQLKERKSLFWGDIRDNSAWSESYIQRAGHTMHAIEDGRGAHKDYIGKVWGHLFAGYSVDRTIGDSTFVSVSNEIYQFLSKDPNAKLSGYAINNLINAIIRQCKKEGFDTNLLHITRPVPTLSGGGSNFFFGGYFWVNSMWDFLSWINSIGEGTVTSTYEINGIG